MKKSIVIYLLFLLPVLSFGQYAEQALRLSTLTYNGTARYTGMGGAFGAIGGDFTTLSVNPAGIGVYKTSEVSFTPLIYNMRSFSNYFGNKEEEFSTRVNMNNVGFVFAAQLPDKIKTIQFGIGYNRLANFNNNTYFKGYNNQNSFVRALSDDATVAYRNGDYYPDQPLYLDELAGAANLFYYDPISDDWNADMPANVYQSALLQTEGGIDEMVFTFGGNYADKLYFGVTLGLPFMSFWQSYQYDEWDPYETTNFRGMQYDEIYESNGVGVNGKFGVIYKPVSFLRIGAAVHTPTYYWNIQENEWMRIASSFYDSTKWNSNVGLPERIFEYSQTTPMRVIGSVAFVPGKIGMINVDYEWVDHSFNKMQPSRNEDIKWNNDLIKNTYKSQHIIRAGAELRAKNVFFRGGYGWYSSPYQDKSLNDGSINTWSLGAGFRAGSFGLDFAYQHARSKSKYYPYDADKYNMWGNAPSPYANLTNNFNSYMLTFSYRY